MGSFSFRRADHSTVKANFVSFRDGMKVLIPKEFVQHYGTSCFRAKYMDYGNINVKNPDGTVVQLDLYGFIAYLNRDMPMPESHLLEKKGGKVRDHYVITDDGWEDTNIQANRNIGIALACYVQDHARCTYKLKCCSPSFKGTYESLHAFSCGDRAQGWDPEYWDRCDCYGNSVLDYYLANCLCD